MAVSLYFNNTPDAFIDTLGQAFEVENLEDFLYENSDVLQGAFVTPDETTLFYVSGTDGGGFNVWDFARIQIPYHSDEGGEGTP